MSAERYSAEVYICIYFWLYPFHLFSYTFGKRQKMATKNSHNEKSN